MRARMIGAVVPAEQGEVVGHGARQEALLAELAHARRAVPLGQLAPVGRQDQRHVPERRLLEPQRLVDQHLRTRMQPLLPHTASCSLSS